MPPEVFPKDKPIEKPIPDQAEARTSLSSSGDSSPPAAIPTTIQDAAQSDTSYYIEQIDGSKDEADNRLYCQKQLEEKGSDHSSSDLKIAEFTVQMNKAEAASLEAIDLGRIDTASLYMTMATHFQTKIDSDR
ncbi:hypothetical protein SARC_12989 [Sphaeroforma arctica JP610]|uniref:Uncharacterized protein n=1 Tax=Sphaeroforma arctica JP610 TaxID=667725 RepID=A0A0L0FDA2_9EUKA|nr:hypothetical protein SARC_12989 [Sphaeroforma arctica JP610]KNC74466.1 hypothetical protein SARC_12989 [Sphaeroforma arctica JP610]|eukprot:XP_014148368.1 hypothetical protein SARC_12989 [Sphaeroforma arctica JP610]